MRIARQIYLYAMTAVALEVAVWALVDLVSTAFAWRTVGADAGLLARGLSLTLVALPVFAVHWIPAQRAAFREAEERGSLPRALFLYGVLLVLLVAVVQNGVVLLDRLFLDAMGLSAEATLFGAYRKPAANGIALVVNALFAAYFATVLRADWKETSPTVLPAVRRLYRYLWAAYTLGLAVAGVQQLLQYLVSLPQVYLGGPVRQAWLANGLALIALGVPLWALAWRTVQRALVHAEEREALLRLGFLYAVSLVGAAIAVPCGAVMLSVLLRRLLGEAISGSEILSQLRVPFSLGLPAAVVWAFHSRQLRAVLETVGEAPRRSALRRLYGYLLSVLGLGATVAGVVVLGTTVVDLAGGSVVWGGAMRVRLGNGLAILAAGLPVWLAAWVPLQREAAAPGDTGDHARRSLTRKVYLYVAVAAGVLGLMGATGSLLFLWLRALLGREDVPLGQRTSYLLVWLVAFASLLAYHALALKRDGALAWGALAARHARFPVVVLDRPGGHFAEAIQLALRRETPSMPVHVWSGPALPGTGVDFRAIVLPLTLVLDPPEALRSWLKSFSGTRIIVLDELPESHVWIGRRARSLADSAHEVAQALRRLAEGQEVRPVGSPAWQVAVYALAALAGLQLLAGLVGALVAFLFRFWD
ncbi:MAG: DUF5671 domain-containing protein [Chloroflexia bacterium]